MPCGRAREAIDDDHRPLRREQPLRRLAHRVGIALRRHRRRMRWHLQRAAIGDDLLLQLAVGDDRHRLHRRRAGDLVAVHEGFREALQRGRLVVPLDEVAHHRDRVLRRMAPVVAAHASGEVQRVAEDRNHRHPVAPGVVQRHRRVLQPYRRVAQRRRRLACRLVVAVRHRDGRLLVHAGDELGRRVAAVVDDRLVQAEEARAGVREDVVDAERADHVDHVVGRVERAGWRGAGRRRRLGGHRDRGARRDVQREQRGAGGRSAAAAATGVAPAALGAAAIAAGAALSTSAPAAPETATAETNLRRFMRGALRSFTSMNPPGSRPSMLRRPDSSHARGLHQPRRAALRWANRPTRGTREGRRR